MGKAMIATVHNDGGGIRAAVVSFYNYAEAAHNLAYLSYHGTDPGSRSPLLVMVVLRAPDQLPALLNVQERGDETTNKFGTARDMPGLSTAGVLLICRPSTVPGLVSDATAQCSADLQWVQEDKWNTE